ncbi:MAG: hypothetical protein U0930_23990 [Pirellulales bacterium]
MSVKSAVWITIRSGANGLKSQILIVIGILMKLFFSSLVAGILLLAQVAPCLAQNNLKGVNTQGTLVNVGDFMVVFKDKKGTEFTAYLDEEKSTFNYRGTADPKAISPGLMVRFTAKFDNNGNAQSELKEMEIFTPIIGGHLNQNQAQTPGIYPTQENEPNAKDAGAKDAGNTAVKNTKDKGKNTKGKDKADPKAKGAEFVEYRVVGQITAAQNGKVQISTGSQMLMVQLANNAKININTIIPDYCAKDDEVTVEGLMSADLPTAIQASKVIVTGAKPVGKSELTDDKKSKGSASKGNSATDNKKPDDKKGSDKKGSDKKTGDKPTGKPGSSN